MRPPPDPTRPHLVFIYGTLKHTFPNSHYMPKTLTYAGTARTTKPYPLVVDTEMGIPFLLFQPNHPNAKNVHGELYYADGAALEFLDQFEGLHAGFYIREAVEVVGYVPCEDDTAMEPDERAAVAPGHVTTALAYFRAPANGGPGWARKWTVERLQTLPMVERYSHEHSSTFVTRTDREGY